MPISDQTASNTLSPWVFKHISFPTTFPVAAIWPLYTEHFRSRDRNNNLKNSLINWFNFRYCPNQEGRVFVGPRNSNSHQFQVQNHATVTCISQSSISHDFHAFQTTLQSTNTTLYNKHWMWYNPQAREWNSLRLGGVVCVGGYTTHLHQGYSKTSNYYSAVGLYWTAGNMAQDTFHRRSFNVSVQRWLRCSNTLFWCTTGYYNTAVYPWYSHWGGRRPAACGCGGWRPAEAMDACRSAVVRHWWNDTTGTVMMVQYIFTGRPARAALCGDLETMV